MPVLERSKRYATFVLPSGAELDVLITHGHPDHHLELMVLSELYCLRMPASCTRPHKGDPLRVHCTQETFTRWLQPVHGFRFAGGENQTLEFKSITPATAGYLHLAIPPHLAGPFSIRAVSTDHFPGAVCYVVEWDRFKVLIGWDLRSLPNPDEFSFMKNPSLALIEANTIYQSVTSGHTSVQDSSHRASSRDSTLSRPLPLARRMVFSSCISGQA